MQQNQLGSGFRRLLEGERHQPVQLGQIGRDENNGWTGPAILGDLRARIRHGFHLTLESVAPAHFAVCARAHP